MINPFGQSPLPDLNDYSDGRCLRVGVLTNPRSGGNKKGYGAILAVLAKHPEVLQREAVDPPGVAQALREFSESGVELVIINGGDGTIHAVLTVLGNDQPFNKQPLLALLRAGTTSMLPRDVGLPGAPAAALARLLAWSSSTNASLTLRSRPVLQVRRGEGAPALFGMFFGAGAICQGIKLFHSKDNPMAWRGQLMPTITMLRLLLAILFRDRDKIVPFVTTTRLDERAPEERSDLFILVSSLERLFLGMRPYWGTEDGPLRFTAVDTEPKYLLRILVSLFRSKKSRHATAVNGYHSHNVENVQLVMNGEFTLDGELYTAGEGTVTVAPAGPVLFVGMR